MRKFTRLLLVAVLFQAGIYFYFDQVILVPAATFSQQIILEGNKQAIDPQKISTDQKYCAKMQADSVTFLTADNKEIKKVPLQAEESVSYFSWVPNSHLALIGISNSTSQSTSVTLKAINLDTNSLPQEPKISGLSAGAKIDSVAFSPLVNVTYMRVTAKTSSSIYRTDANNKLTKVFTNSTLERIACLQSVDMLLYDNKADKSVYARSTNGKIKMVSPKVGHFALIGTDKDDNIYIGRLSSTGLVSTILKGTINGNFTEYQTFTTPSSQASITVSYDGKLQLK
ncbi:MAG: hypothetical protein CVU90_04435 [Firmicutes bacterium HGW-Firmicutes-15]|nr:MAG: hypothetical protein CVU90_04435 [Firmicutes bacterium HGW-Firmicutes-15]